MSLIAEEGWQVGDDAVLVATLTDPRTKEPIDPATVAVTVSGTKGDGSTFSLTPTNTANTWEAPIFFDVAGTWRGHLVVSGDRRRKLPFRVIVGNG